MSGRNDLITGFIVISENFAKIHFFGLQCPLERCLKGNFKPKIEIRDSEISGVFHLQKMFLAYFGPQQRKFWKKLG